MIDIKLIRKNSQQIKEMLNDRNQVINIDEFLQLDTQLKEYQIKSQDISAYRNKLAKEIGILKSQQKDTTDLLTEVSKYKQEEDILVNKTKNLEAQINSLLLLIPNIPHSSVPKGKNELDNVEINKFLTPKSFAFKPKEHFELGINLGLMDFDKASELSGSRFVILKGDLAKLERAIGAFMLDVHTQKNGYTEYSVPVLMNEEMLYNTAQLPKFKEDLFCTTDNKWLISTTEIPLTNLVSNTILTESQLPIRSVALSLCFRSEAGSAGRDTKGMIRQHQFYKVELVSIAKPEESYKELEHMTDSAQEILKQLELPYRTMLLCCGDMGFASSKTYDIEVWLPGQNTYREISSCSNCEDFQARRMKARYKNIDNTNVLVHTLNGSGLAVGRTLVAILENYQNEDGSINVPNVLIPYMNGQTLIKKQN